MLGMGCDLERLDAVKVWMQVSRKPGKQVVVCFDGNLSMNFDEKTKCSEALEGLRA